MNNELSTCNEERCCTPASTEEKSATQTRVRPHYEVDRNDESFRLRIFVPGSSKSNVSLSINDGLLTVTAKRNDTVADGWKPLRREISRHDYRLEVRVPDKVDATAINASVEDGILSLTLPIREADKPRSIEVQ